MTTRKALVTISGVTQQLPSGDDLDVPGLTAQRTAQKEPSGFESPDDIAVAYDSTGRTITLTQTGGVVVWVNGTRYVKTSPWVSSAHTDEAGKYWLTVDATGSLAWSESVWAINEVQVAYVYYEPSSEDVFAMREVHGLMPWQVHQELHETIGTYRRSGLTLEAGTYATSPASPADTDNTPGVDLGVLADEDLATNLPALTQGTYTHLYFEETYGSGTIQFTPGQSLPFRVGTTYIKYWGAGPAAESEAVTNRWLNVYLLAVPMTTDATSQAYRFLWMQPQAAYTSLASAQAEAFDRLSSSSLASLLTAVPEFFPVAQITYRTSSTYTGATGRCRIEGVQYLTGSRAHTVIAGAAQPLVQIAAEGTLVGTEPQINFIAGSGIAFTVADTPASSRVDVTAALNVNGLTADTDPDDTDTAPIYSADASANRKVTLANLKTYFQTAIPLTSIDINGATADTDPDDGDLAAIYSGDATANRKVTLANLKTYFQAGGAGGAVTFNEPAADNAAGTQAIFDSGTVGETVAFPNLLYLKSDGKWWLADADAAATMPGLRMALESKNADESCSMLVTGRVRDDDWNWTVGGVVYASTTAGGYTQTAPSGAADIVQQVGIAYHADKMVFMPSMTTIEIV